MGRCAQRGGDVPNNDEQGQDGGERAAADVQDDADGTEDELWGASAGA